MKILEARIGRVVTRVAGLILGVVFMLHAFACMFHFVAVANGTNLTWIQASGIVNSNSTVDRCVGLPPVMVLLCHASELIAYIELSSTV